MKSNAKKVEEFIVAFSDKVEAIGLSIKANEVMVDDEYGLPVTRLFCDMNMLPGARIVISFGCFSEGGEPECAISFYGGNGDFSCMPNTNNLDLALFNYGRAVQAYNEAVAKSLRSKKSG